MKTPLKNELILIRGVSGAGKTTIAELLNVDEIISTDDFFTNADGHYSFDYTKLKEAHEWCRQEVEDSMKIPAAEGWRIAIANTFTREWEMQTYFDLAEEYGYRVHTIIVENRHNSESTHDIPGHVIQKQRDRFEVVL